MTGRKKDKTKRISFRFGIPKSGQQRRGGYRPNPMSVLKVTIAVCIIAAAGAGFIFLDKYVKKNVYLARKTLSVELADVPEWVNEQLKEKIYVAVRTYDKELKSDEDTARRVQQDIESQAAWLAEVKVQTTGDSIVIKGRWRKPLALVKSGFKSFYLDADMVVLDYVPMPNLPIVRIKDFSVITKPPLPGKIWQRDDVSAAVVILARLEQMDKSVTPDKPLLYEIDSIDVSNFDGRASSRQPHIVLYTKDNTEIIWGAEFGTWQRYLEATDEEKLTNLYAYYKEHGSLLGGAKYINLQYSQTSISLPIDKY